MNNKIVILAIYITICVSFGQSLKYTCQNLGSLTVFYDEQCSNGASLGCNAGGQGQNCRFCGFDVYPPCPTSTTTTTTTTTTRSTTTTSANSGGTTGTSTEPNPNPTVGPPTEWDSAPDPVKRKYVDHPVKRPTTLENHSGPIPTNSWYQNLLMGNGELTIQLLPTMIQAKSTGLSISNSDKKDLVVEPKYVLQPFVEDWKLTTTGTFLSKKVSNLKELSVTLKYYAENLSSMEIPLIQGLPFITAIYNKILPKLTTIRAILSVKVDNSVTYRPGEVTTAAKKFVIHLNSGVYWVLYSSMPIVFKIDSNDLIVTLMTAAQIVDCVLKLGSLGASDTSTAWDKYANGYVNSADLTYQTLGNKAELKYTWNVKGGTDVFMYALQHHVATLKNPQKLGVKAYCIRGEMEGIVGQTWTMEIPLSDISWNARKSIDPAKRQEILDALKADQNLVVSAPDPYWFGLEIARSGRLAVIADQLGETAIAQKIRTNMKSLLIPWLEGTNSDPLRYEKVYGGTPTADGLADAGADYGNGYYNDHHFHYGYHVYALAAIAKNDSAFFKKYEKEIYYYVRDYANPSRTDPYFTFTRHKDWFGWHSWAAGLYEFADNRNQESTSEAINGYYALSLLGQASGDPYLEGFGKLLTAMEIISTKAYWQMPSYSTVYPDKFKSNLMVGVLWSTKVDYATFFGGNHEFIHGIQFLPFTPITEEYLDSNFMKEEKEFLDKNVPTTTEDWLGYLIEAKAVVDKENQWTNARKLEEFHAGSSRTNCYYWIATR